MIDRPTNHHVDKDKTMDNIISLLFKSLLIVHMKFFLITIILYLPLSITIQQVHSQPISCSCQLDGTSMTMICDNVHSILNYQQCLHEQLNSQSDLKLRRGNIITNLTIRNHQLQTISDGLLQFSYGNYFYQLNDVRYLSIIHGTLKQIDYQAFTLIERTLEYLDLSNNSFQQMPKISNNNEQYNNLVKLILKHNQIYYVTLSDIRAYKHLQYLDLSFNRLQSIDMTIINYLIYLKQFYLNSNLLKTLTNNITFPNNFHFKLSSNPFECDCRIRWLRNALNRLEYPIYHDEPKCEMPKALSDKNIVTLRDEQFVCGPIISKPDLTSLFVTNGEIATLRCDVYSDPAPEVWWTFQNKIIGKMISNINESDIHTGSYTIRYSCLSINSCLNKTTTLTITNIGIEHNGTYNCVAAIRNQGRSDNEYLSYELRVRGTSTLTDNSFLLWIIGLFLFIFSFLLILLCLCWIIRCHKTNRKQAERNKILLFDNDLLMDNEKIYKEKSNGNYDPYDMIDSRSQLGPPMYSEVRIVDSTPLKSIGGGGSISSTLLRRNDPFYESYRSDKQIYEYHPSSSSSQQQQQAPIGDEFEDEMIFPSGYEEDYQYREDIIKPNQVIDPRRQAKLQHTNHDRSNYKFESQYKGLVESQL